MNRPNHIYYIRKPEFKKIESDAEYLLNLGGQDFVQMQPKFNTDFSKLAFFGSREKFLSHTGNYEMRVFEWPPVKDMDSKVLIDTVDEIKEDQFGGVYGYNHTYNQAGYLNERYFIFETERKGQNIIYLLDTETKAIE